MSRGLKRYAVIVLLLYILAAITLPQATAVFEFRQGLRAGNILYNNDVGGVLAIRALFHQETLANSDTEAFAMSPLLSTGNGLTMAQTSTDTVVATQTGLDATARFAWIPYDVGHKIGDTPEWAADVQPINFAGIPSGSMMIFPSMTMIKRVPNSMENDTHNIIDANASLPMYPGNIMLAKNITDEQGRNTTILERPPQNYWTPYASDQEIANMTIMQRMWANSHIGLNLDRAYLGETCYPTLIYPVKSSDILTVMPLVPDSVSMGAAMNLTHPGLHLRKAFWPVG